MNVKLFSSEMRQNIRRQIPKDNNRYSYISAELTHSFGSHYDLHSADADSNLGQYTNCPEFYRSLPQFLKANAETGLKLYHYIFLLSFAHYSLYSIP
jgi:succinylglutamate desuccinylase